MIDEEYNIVKQTKHDGTEFEFGATVNEYTTDEPSRVRKRKKRQVSVKMQSMVSAVAMTAVVAGGVGGAVSLSKPEAPVQPTEQVVANVDSSKDAEQSNTVQNGDIAGMPEETTVPTEEPTPNPTTEPTAEPEPTQISVATPVVTPNVTTQNVPMRRPTPTQSTTRVVSSSSYTTLGTDRGVMTPPLSPVPSATPSPSPVVTHNTKATPTPNDGSTVVEGHYEDLSTSEPVSTKEPSSNVQTQSYTTDITLELQGE